MSYVFCLRSNILYKNYQAEIGDKPMKYPEDMLTLKTNQYQSNLRGYQMKEFDLHYENIKKYFR